jgi:hypothetical protein
MEVKIMSKKEWNNISDLIMELEDMEARNNYYFQYELYEDGLEYDFKDKKVKGIKLA